MWHALRAELAYFRPYLIGGLGLGVGVVVIVSAVFFAVGDDGPPSHAAAGIRGMFLIMAPLIVGFIAQAYRVEERRARLLLAGLLTPRQLAGAMVLLPVALFAIGAVAAGLVTGVGVIVTGRFELESLNIVGFVGALMFAYAQIGLLIQEATAAHGQRRRRAAAAGWTVLVLAVAYLAALYLFAAQGSLGSRTWIHLIAGHLSVAVAAMVATVVLYTGRVDFTR